MLRRLLRGANADHVPVIHIAAAVDLVVSWDLVPSRHADEDRVKVQRMVTLNAHQARMVGFEFDDVRPLCRAVHIPTADRGQRGSLRIVR
jgi:hypothetical protein